MSFELDNTPSNSLDHSSKYQRYSYYFNEEGIRDLNSPHNENNSHEELDPALDRGFVLETSHSEAPTKVNELNFREILRAETDGDSLSRIGNLSMESRGVASGWICGSCFAGNSPKCIVF